MKDTRILVARPRDFGWIQNPVSFTDVRVRVPPLVLFKKEVFAISRWLTLKLSTSNVPRLLSGRCHDGAHTASNLVYQKEDDEVDP